MNPNIRRLIERSGFYVAYENKEVTDKELEALIQLAIKECMKVANSYTSETSDLHYGWLIRNRIAKHFGIKR